jgi:Lrp/AsnC family leucine-responsive transcriptional regulator
MLDNIDLIILDIIQDNGRVKRSTLADKVKLSISSLSERLRKLEEAGIIEGYYAKLNRAAIGFDIVAFIQVLTDSSKNYTKLVSNAQHTPEIVECHSVLGEGSHILKVETRGRDELEKLLAKIQSWPGVIRTITSFVLSTNKETTKLDIKNKGK